MQGLFHDHVKRQLLWKCWDVFFKYVKGYYAATMMVMMMMMVHMDYNYEY